MEAVQVEGDEFSDADAGGVHQLQHGGVATGLGGFVLEWLAEEGVHLGGAHRLWDGLGGAGRVDFGGGVGGEVASIDEEGAEGFHGGDLAGDGGFCVLALVEVSEEIEDELSVDRLHAGGVAIVGTVVGGWFSRGGEAREAAEIVSIGVDGVLGGAAFGGQVVQEVFYSIQH